MSEQPRADLARLFADRFAQGCAPALAIRAVRGSDLRVDGMFGSTGPGSGAPTGATAFRIASCTKSFTAAGILVLRGAGLLDLDEDVRTYLPQLRLTGPVSAAYPAGRVSLRMLLTMSAGFPSDNPWADRLEAMPRADFDAMLAAGIRPVHRPGSVFEYSNLGYALLGRVIERTSGQDYPAFITDALLRPLRLHSTGFDPRGPVPLAVGYRRAPAGWEPQPLTGPGAFSAIGGLVSTVADLHRWVGWLAAAFDPDTAATSGDDDGGTDGGSPLTRGDRRDMQQIHQTCPALPDDPPGLVRGYGFGIRVEEDPRAGQVFFHSGGYPGYSSHMRWHPASGSAVVGFETATYSGVGVPARRALDLLVGTAAPALAPAPAPEPAPAPVSGRKSSGPLQGDSRLDWPELAPARAAVEAFLLRRDKESEQALRSLFSANVELDVPWDERLEQLDAIRGALGPLGSGGSASAADPPADSSADSAAGEGSGAVLRWSQPAACGRLTCEIHLSPAEPPLVSVLRFAAQLPAGTGQAGNESMDPVPRPDPRIPIRKREHPMDTKAPAGKKKLDDLTPSERKGLGVATAIQFLLAGAALVDIWRRPEAQVRGSRGWWSAACAVNFVGPLSWFAFGRKKG